jgi:HAD superfamily hydrolase (TIGR01549 family)
MTYVFDMDGTLLRLPVDIEEARQRIAALYAPHGVTRPFRPNLARIQDGAKEAGKPELVAQAYAILDVLEVAGAPEAKGAPHAAEVIAALVARGARLGLVTDNGAACVPLALRAVGIDPAVFEAVWTRDAGPAKPSPVGLTTVLEQLGAGDDCWYVGDHPRDLEAGKGARAKFPQLRLAAVKTGLAQEAQLLKGGADRVIDRLDSLLA